MIAPTTPSTAPSTAPRTVRPLNLAALAHPDNDYDDNPVADFVYNDINVSSDAAHRVLTCLTTWGAEVYTQDETRTDMVRASVSSSLGEVVDCLNRVRTLLDLIVPAFHATEDARVALAAGNVTAASAALARRTELLGRAKTGLTDAHLAALEAVLFAPTTPVENP